MTKSAKGKASANREGVLFDVQAAYADSVFRSGINDQHGSIVALERCLELDPTYPPAILSMGSVEYQRGRPAHGRRLFRSLLALPNGTIKLSELREIVDEAGDFLIQRGAFEDGPALFRAAVDRFPESSAFHQGLACCAGHQGLYDEAVKASEQALRLDPGNQTLTNDLGWSLLQAGHFREAEKMLGRAVAMDASDLLARENLRVCEEKISTVMTKPATTGK